MNKLLFLLFGILIIGCCNQPKLLNNGLTKKAIEITEYTIRIEKDSLNNSILDTVVITKKIYNDNDQIINRFQRNLFEDESIEIEFDYDKNKKIIKETVKLSNESSIISVDYFYKDSLIYSTKSEFINDTFRFKQIGEYEYSSKNILKESSLFHQFIDLETNDTTANRVEISKYNKNKLVIEIKTIDYIKPERNRKTEYDYDCETLMKVTKFNHNDSLISKTKYKYKLDRFQNWIERQSFENGKLNYIESREIKYK